MKREDCQRTPEALPIFGDTTEQAALLEPRTNEECPAEHTDRTRCSLPDGHAETHSFPPRQRTGQPVTGDTGALLAADAGRRLALSTTDDRAPWEGGPVYRSGPIPEGAWTECCDEPDCINPGTYVVMRCSAHREPRTTQAVTAFEKTVATIDADGPLGTSVLAQDAPTGSDYAWARNYRAAASKYEYAEDIDVLVKKLAEVRAEGARTATAREALARLEENLVCADTAKHSEGYARGLRTAISLVRDVIDEGPQASPLLAESVLIERAAGYWAVTSERGDITVRCPSEAVADRIAGFLTGFLPDCPCPTKAGVSDAELAEEWERQYRYAIDKLRTTLGMIRTWDMLNPAKGAPEPLGDGPWLRGIIDEAMVATTPRYGACPDYPTSPVLEVARDAIDRWRKGGAAGDSLVKIAAALAGKETR